MGFVYAEITLKNAADTEFHKRGSMKEPEIRQTTVTAIVDTGAANLVINEDIRQQLGLRIDGSYTAKLADGSVKIYSRTEPVEIKWKNRESVQKPILVPSANEILLGAIPLEDMDLIVNPVKQELTGAHGDEIIFRI